MLNPGLREDLQMDFCRNP